VAKSTLFGEGGWPRWIYEHSVFRYLISGGFGALIHFAILTLLVERFGSNDTLATSVGFVIGSVVNYTLQYHWTFSADGPHHIMFTRYAAVTLITMTINAGLFWLFTHQFGLYYLYSQIIATGMMVFVNFYINKHFTFASATPA